MLIISLGHLFAHAHPNEIPHSGGYHLLWIRTIQLTYHLDHHNRHQHRSRSRLKRDRIIAIRSQMCDRLVGDGVKTLSSKPRDTKRW